MSITLGNLTWRGFAMSGFKWSLLPLALSSLCACGAGPSQDGNTQIRNEVFKGAVPAMVKFVPQGKTIYPSVPKHEVKCYKMLNHFSGGKDVLFRDEKPTRPYIVLGVLEYNLTWWHDGDIQGVLNENVCKVGGDDVLMYESFQSGANTVIDAAVAKPGRWYYQSMQVAVIKFTDKS